MSLSARIAIVPSRRIERLATLLPAGGVIVATATFALRWPAALPVLLVIASAASIALIMAARMHRSTSITLVVSHHPEIDVRPAPNGIDAPWRLAESTVRWPGFSMLALRPCDPTIRARTIRVAVSTPEQDPVDRRALSRFLVWALHGGVGGDQRSSHS